MKSENFNGKVITIEETDFSYKLFLKDFKCPRCLLEDFKKSYNNEKYDYYVALSNIFSYLKAIKKVRTGQDFAAIIGVKNDRTWKDFKKHKGKPPKPKRKRTLERAYNKLRKEFS